MKCLTLTLTLTHTMVMKYLNQCSNERHLSFKFEITRHVTSGTRVTWHL